jgi:uncharacterized protein (TIGR02996 family)
MTHEDAFLQDILEHRDDDTPRLIYADYLLDHGDPAGMARGEFIHIQCELARLPEGAASPPALKAREKQLQEAHRREWGSLFQRLGCHSWEYRRGFVEGISIPTADFIAQAANLFRAAPIREVKLYEVGAVVIDLAGCPHLARVSTLDLENNGLGDLESEVLMGSPHLTGLTTLLLWSNRIGDVGLQDLARRSTLPRLERLDLSGNLIGNAGVAALAASPLLGRLTLLDLQGNQISDPGALALARSSGAANLIWLDLGKNPIGQGAQAVLRERFASRVHVWG